MRSKTEKLAQMAKTAFLISTVISLVTVGLLVRTLRLSEDPCVKRQIKEILGLSKPADKVQEKVKISVMEPVYSDHDGKTLVIKGGSIAYGYIVDAEEADKENAGKIYVELSSIKPVRTEQSSMARLPH